MKTTFPNSPILAAGLVFCVSSTILTAEVVPLIDHPLREPSICKGADGVYYLTGTDGTPSAPEHGEVSFDNNDGIRVWKSTDLKTWKPLGRVWDFVTYPDGRESRDWWRYLQVKPREPYARPMRGVSAPEIHYLKNTFWIIFAVSEQPCGLLRSTSGKAEGPYELNDGSKGDVSHLPMLDEAASPSLFEDADGTVYVLWGDGWIAPMNDEMTGLAAEPRQLRGEGLASLGHRGYHLRRIDDRYYLSAEKLVARDGRPASDVYVAVSDSLLGPYSSPELMIPHAGQTTLFEGPDGKLLATWWGNDPRALFLERPGLVELARPQGDRLPRLTSGTSTTRPGGALDPAAVYQAPRLLPSASVPVGPPPKGQDVTIGRQQWVPNQEKMRPVLDHPLRQPSVCRGPDGYFYLTGADGTPADGDGVDFDNNDGIRVWRSKDLATWEELGKVFDNTPKNSDFAKNPWWSQPVADPFIPMKPLARGVYAPEIHYLKDTFWICFSVGQQACGLLKSESGRAEGPYIDMGMIVPEGGSPSLFQDDDGSVHLLWGSGWIARMKDDMTGLAEAPRQLRCKMVPQAPRKGKAKPDAIANYPLRVGQDGFFLFKKDNTYYLTAQQREYVEGVSSPWVLVASSKTLHGPYGFREWMLAYSEQTTVFKGPDDGYYATWSGADEDAAFRDRAGIIPLRWENRSVSYAREKVDLPRMMPGIVVERGPWHELLPVSEHGMRDVMCMLAPDGFYYYAGSLVDPVFAGRLVVFRSRDLVNWEEKELLTIKDLDWLGNGDWRLEQGKKKGGLVDKFMDAEIHFLKGTFYMVYALYRPKDKDAPEIPEGTRDGGAIVMRSTSGTIDGPWEHLDYGFGQGHFFEDDDGTVYAAGGATKVVIMDPDMNGFDKHKQFHALPQDGCFPFADVGGYLRKIEGKYAFFSCGQGSHSQTKSGASFANYAYHYIWSDSPTGPWRRGRVGVPNGGHGGVFQDKQGRWWAAFFNTADEDSLRNWNVIPGIVPLETSIEDGELIIRVADDVPSDYLPSTNKTNLQEEAWRKR